MYTNTSNLILIGANKIEIYIRMVSLECYLPFALGLTKSHAVFRANWYPRSPSASFEPMVFSMLILTGEPDEDQCIVTSLATIMVNTKLIE